MQIGAEVAIHARGDAEQVGDVVGAGRLIHPQLVQVLPPLDAELSRIVRQAGEFVIVTPDGNHRVSRIRPGLVSYSQAAEVLYRELPEIELVATESGIVVFETEEVVVEDARPLWGQPWWCSILCLNSCTGC